MNYIYIVANWKANKKESEAESWFREFLSGLSSLDIDNKKIIICPSFVLLSCARKMIGSNEYGLGIGSQDISSFPEGAYTGEVPYLSLSGIADYSIIGHSERRNNFGESDEVLEKKVANAVSASIVPIFCVPNADTFIPNDVSIVAYEPIGAIGSGNPDTPENADEIARLIKRKNKGVESVLYGGSVSAFNVKSFISMENIDGVLVGGASLDPESFKKIIENA